MKKFYALLIIMGIAVAVSGCAENKTRIGEGAGIGGLLGAAAGGIIGHQGGHGWEGALIGGAAGAAGGAMVGSQIEKPQATTTTTTTTTTTVSGGLTMTQIVNLSKEGVSSDEIIAKIQSSNVRYSLTADDVAYLQRQGVSQRVIEAMQAANR